MESFSPTALRLNSSIEEQSEGKEHENDENNHRNKTLGKIFTTLKADKGLNLLKLEINPTTTAETQAIEKTNQTKTKPNGNPIRNSLKKSFRGLFRHKSYHEKERVKIFEHLSGTFSPETMGNSSDKTTKRRRGFFVSKALNNEQLYFLDDKLRVRANHWPDMSCEDHEGRSERVRRPAQRKLLNLIVKIASKNNSPYAKVFLNALV